MIETLYAWTMFLLAIAMVISGLAVVILMFICIITGLYELVRDWREQINK